MIKLSSVTTLLASALLAIVLLTACGTSEEEDLTPGVTPQGTATVGIGEEEDLTPGVTTQGTATAGIGEEAPTRVTTPLGPTTVGIDADPTGNTATTLGAIDACVSVTTGQSFDIDVFVTDVRDLFGWDATLNYDGSVVHLVDMDAQLFQASNPGSQVVDFSSDSLPDTDGSHTLGVGEMTEASADSGSGVLLRLTLTAAAPGTSKVSLTGLMLRDMHGAYVSDPNGDQFFDGSLSEAEIRVDEPCP
jgi:hypothetical protein